MQGYIITSVSFELVSIQCETKMDKEGLKAEGSWWWNSKISRRKLKWKRNQDMNQEKYSKNWNFLGHRSDC